MNIRQNFTLIELLVVVAIIGILASMLLPSVAKSRKQVQQSVCLNNQRQVGIATISYATDNNEFCPSDNIIDLDQRWHNFLIPAYLPAGEIDQGASAVQQCPNGLDLDAAWKSTIAMNHRMTGKNQVGGNAIQRSIVAASVNETCLLMDSYDAWRSTGNYNMTTERLIGDADAKKNIARHVGKKANVTFLDGSGRAIRYNWLIEKTNFWNAVFWNPED